MKATLLGTCLLLLSPAVLCGQDAEPSTQESPETSQTTPAESSSGEESPAESGSDFEQTAEQATEKAKEIAGDAADKAADIAVKIDQNETAQDAAAGVLQPIYLMAETLAFPAFYWLAFALMAAGTVSYAFQLVLGKLVVLSKGSINLKEIVSDAVSFIISAVGLVLTTQAATENSTFTQSAAMVLSSTAVGVVFGLYLYRWGQAQEVNAVKGERTTRPKK